MSHFNIQNFSYYSDHHNHHQNLAVDRNSTTPIIDNVHLQNKIIQKSERKTKRKRNESKEEDKSEEVIQVRAKRGQATDSHSLAERVRRKKINERLKCLQTLVPGCYETMGMAVMLDAVISYVQSLQNQIEFLSMKLSTANMHYDGTNSIINTTQILNPIHHLVQEIDEKIEREGFEGCFNNFH